MTGIETDPDQFTATEQAICDAWRDSLATRSRLDTQVTQDDVGLSRKVWQKVCERS